MKSIFVNIIALRAGILILVQFFILSGSPVSAQLRIMEVCPSNSTVLADPDFGDYSDWIELYNGTSFNIDLGGYALSDDSTDIYKWQFPVGTTLGPGAFLLVYADGKGQSLHSSFNLDKQGEYVLLSDATGALVDSLSFPFMLNDMSYGRIAGSPETLSVFRKPTPGTANRTGTPELIAPFPDFSVEGGFYDGSFKLGFAPPPGGANIYFTLDGSYPSENASLYTDSIVISSTTVVRAIVIGPDLIPGIAKTGSYFVNEPQNLPVFSMVTDAEHLFSDETGIMVQGTNGKPGYCTDIPHNLNQDWERPVNIEFFEMGSEQVINQLCGTKIFGGCSRIRYPQKSLGFYARSEYEYSSFSYQLFPDKPSSDYETFILRACGDDQPHTFFRDPLTHMLVKDVIDVDMQAYRPVVLYINGQYWGIINLREKINEHYVQDNYGIHPDSVDILKRIGEDDWNIISGDNTEYKSMMDFVRNNDLSLPGNYSYIESQIDIDEYINYQVTQVFLGARDWPGNNIKYWRSGVEPYTKWRWILYDLDHHFKEYFSDIMEEATEVDCGCGWPNPPRSTLLFRKLLENEIFRNEFIARFNLLATTTFERDRMHNMVDQLRDSLLPEIPRHIERWGGQKVTHIENTWMSPVFNSIEEWDAKIQVMHDFIDRRHEVALQHLHRYFGIEQQGTRYLGVKLTGSEDAAVRFNGAVIKDSVFSGQHTYGTSIQLESLAGEGFILSGTDRVTYDREESLLITTGDFWRYDDSGNWPADNWMQPGFDDSGWETGFAEFGYGDGDEATVVDYGPDPANKYLTTRFRKSFTLGDPAAYNVFELRFKRDDGISIYLNGVEVVRNNLDRWYVGNDTPATATVSGDEENRFLVFNLNPALFVNGDNLIAAEVHQVSGSSSDISFDLQLNATSLSAADTLNMEGGVVDIEMLADQEITFRFVPDTNIVETVFINEIMADNNSGFQDETGDHEDWIEFYNAGPHDVDLAGLYLSDTLPSVKTWRFPGDMSGLTTIPAGGHLLVVADNEEGSELLHTSFRLNNDGEEVILLQRSGEDTLVIDRVTFGSQYEDITWGRYPDGADEFAFMPVNTPWMSNYLAPEDTTGVVQKNANDGLLIFPNPSEGAFMVRTHAVMAQPAVVSVYTVTGTKLFTREYGEPAHMQVELPGRLEGIFIVEVVSGEKRYIGRVVVHRQ